MVSGLEGGRVRGVGERSGWPVVDGKWEVNGWLSAWFWFCFWFGGFGLRFSQSALWHRNLGDDVGGGEWCEWVEWYVGLVCGRVGLWVEEKKQLGEGLSM